MVGCRAGVTYLCYALMMCACLPAGDQVRRNTERALLRRLEMELRCDDDAALTTSAAGEA